MSPCTGKRGFAAGFRQTRSTTARCDQRSRLLRVEQTIKHGRAAGFDSVGSSSFSFPLPAAGLAGKALLEFRKYPQCPTFHLTRTFRFWSISGDSVVRPRVGPRLSRYSGVLEREALATQHFDDFHLRSLPTDQSRPTPLYSITSVGCAGRRKVQTPLSRPAGSAAGPLVGSVG